MDKCCVEVTCRCPYSPDFIYYPKDIIGFHRVDVDDPRAVVGATWTQNHCHGYYYSQGCDDEMCVASGEVITVFADCKDCPNKDSCPLKEADPSLPAL